MELAVSEFLDELRQGRRPAIEVYVQRYPQYAEELREMLPLVAAMESWKVRHEYAGARSNLPEAMSLERLGDCRIVREIGRGGMGVVFEAVREPDGQRVAVKLLPGKFPQTSLWRRRFYGEAQTTARLTHHHIVPVYGFGEQEGWCYYSMQLIEGVGLDRIIRLLKRPIGEVYADEIVKLFAAGREADEKAARRATPAGTASRVLRRDSWLPFAKVGMQVAAALRYAHAQGVLHRDIKPANLLLDKDGSVWVADFGIATRKDPLLRMGTDHLGGTLPYIAPEQLEGQIDERSDVYSLGATLYELCTLHPIYAGKDRDTLFEHVRSSQPKRPRAINPQIPPELEQILLKAIARDPARRYRSADSLLGALRSFVQSKGSSSSAAWL